ncbi:hypothetical protein [Nocardioides aequoreus]|uniref:hypothetical protein n=1 Tax=Nocardioides aequoreus TaxID=397278 RepID=UPI0004C3EF86|nr:hypothetical protein [Nocardioides aequoreus]
MLRRLVPLLVLALLAGSLGLLPTAAAADDGATRVEGYAPYDGQTRCSPKAKPGAVAMRAWTVDRFGGRAGGISRACSKGVSEHKEGRAFDWTVTAKKKKDRLRVRKLLRTLFAEGPSGEAHELARRMGVMYVIWDDRMWASYRGFEPSPYVSSGCNAKKLRKCSATLRHRDHVHVSLSRKGGRAKTSWYATPEGRSYR